jgi:hypothetical protein
MEGATLIRFLQDLEKETGLPFHSQKKVLTTIYNLINRYPVLESDTVIDIIVNEISKGRVEKLFRGRNDNNLSICIYYSGRYALNNHINSLSAQKRQADLVSLDSANEDGHSLSETEGNNDSERGMIIADTMNTFYNSLTHKEKVLYSLLIQEEDDDKIAEVFDCSRSYANRMRNRFYEMAKKRISNYEMV